MEELISYRHSNRLKLGMWLGAAVMVALICAYQSASANPSDSYIVRIVSIGILAFFWVFFLRRAGIDKHLGQTRRVNLHWSCKHGSIARGVIPPINAGEIPPFTDGTHNSIAGETYLPTW